MKKEVRDAIGLDRGCKQVLRQVGWPLAAFAAVHWLCLQLGAPPSLADVAAVTVFAAAVTLLWGLWDLSRTWAAQFTFFLGAAAAAGLIFHRQAGLFITIGILFLVCVVLAFIVMMGAVYSHGDPAVDFLALAWFGQIGVIAWVLYSDRPALSGGIAVTVAAASLTMRWWPSKPQKYSSPAVEKVMAEADRKYLADGDVVLSIAAPDVLAALESKPSRDAREELFDRFDYAPETTLAQCRAAVAFCEASTGLYGVLDTLGRDDDKLTGRLLANGDVIRDEEEGPETVPTAYFAARIAEEAFLPPEAALKVWLTIVSALLAGRLRPYDIQVEPSPDRREARLRVVWDDPDDPSDETPPSTPSP